MEVAVWMYREKTGRVSAFRKKLLRIKNANQFWSKFHTGTLYTGEDDDDRHEIFYGGRSTNETETDKDDEKPEPLVSTLFIVGDLIALIFGISYVWMQYLMRRSFAHKTGLKEKVFLLEETLSFTLKTY